MARRGRCRRLRAPARRDRVRRAWLPLAVLALGLARCAVPDDERPDNRPAPAPDAMVDPTPEAESIRVMTFNVLCSFCDSAFPPWGARLESFRDVFARHDPDLIGLQELFTSLEVEQVRQLVDGFVAVYYEGPPAYADAVLLIREARFDVLGTGSYWLSPTPDTPMSTGFIETGQLPRLVVWANIRERATGRELYFATSHFDPNDPNPEISAPLVLERLKPWAPHIPVIVTGDLNHRPDEAGYRILVGELEGPEGTSTDRLDDAWVLAHDRRELANRDPAPEYDPADRIDHILVGGADWSVDWWAVDLFEYGEPAGFPSDHRAISASLRLPTDAN